MALSLTAKANVFCAVFIISWATAALAFPKYNTVEWSYFTIQRILWNIQRNSTQTQLRSQHFRLQLAFRCSWYLQYKCRGVYIPLTTEIVFHSYGWIIYLMFPPYIDFVLLQQMMVSRKIMFVVFCPYCTLIVCLAHPIGVKEMKVRCFTPSAAGSFWHYILCHTHFQTYLKQSVKAHALYRLKMTFKCN